MLEKQEMEIPEEVKVFVSNGDVLVPDSKLKIGDLIKFRYEDISTLSSGNHRSMKTSYSVITKVLPTIEAIGEKRDKFVIKLLYITENKKGVEEKDILDLMMNATKSSISHIQQSGRMLRPSSK